MKLSKMSWYADPLRVPFTGTKGLCRQLTSAHCVLQHVLTPLCHIRWPTTSWLSFCSSQLLPLCYNSANS
ncbi:unnamed protein product [Staurois parvus]|uniref:Uncharacterized protein n=1 Tax=Staurois parvus TaxID=386267 RepID=A0ABN9G1D6_9NEOB|nr:unnamed protein product [Staurois parvus]